MRKSFLQLCIAAGLAVVPALGLAAEFGMVDTAKVQERSTEIQKTKQSLESRKDQLQKEFEAKREEVKKLDDKYVSIAKQIQDLRDKKKEKDAQNMEGQLKDLRQQLSQKTSELQKFFEESQKGLYELEQKELGSLYKNIDGRLDSVISEIAKKNKFKAVFNKSACFYADDASVKDITEEVVTALNAASSPAKPKK